ncbi:hypothetical protein [Halocatena salina]|nr:hypothetical protein [Halocatena salina]
MALIGATIFNGIVQPALVDFHPMFSDHPPGFDPEPEPSATLFHI